jgi:hypothetical protein
VGGIGIAPGGNINYETGHAIFEATHGTAPKYADLDKVNPGSVILSGCMMLRYMGWGEAADAIEAALEKTIGQKRVTYDFERQMEGATVLKTSGSPPPSFENLRGPPNRKDGRASGGSSAHRHRLPPPRGDEERRPVHPVVAPGPSRPSRRA